MFFFSSRRRHTSYIGDWSSDVCSSDLIRGSLAGLAEAAGRDGDEVVAFAPTSPEGRRVIPDALAGIPVELRLKALPGAHGDRKSTRLNSSHRCISYAVFCLKKKNTMTA